MKKLTSLGIMVPLIGLFFFLAALLPPAAARAEIGLVVRDQTLSADLEGVPLRAVLQKLKNEEGIWYQGSGSLLDEPVSVRFKNLPFNEGFRRILSSVNHALVFDGYNKVVGLYLFDKAGTGGKRPLPGVRHSKNRRLSEVLERAKALREELRSDEEGPVEEETREDAGQEEGQASPLPDEGASRQQGSQAPAANAFARFSSLLANNPFSVPGQGAGGSSEQKAPGAGTGLLTQQEENAVTNPATGSEGDSPTANPFNQMGGSNVSNPLAQLQGDPSNNPFAQFPGISIDNPFAQLGTSLPVNPFEGKSQAEIEALFKKLLDQAQTQKP